ncbi:nucleotide exchange factor GrpE [Candidatus Saccharibacteria bacterium]|nr:nucleotide exchange factor GrpE [Candidatus Saccharibacteria bacterium]
MTEKNEKSNQTKPNFKIQLDNISIESDLNGIKIQEKEPTKNEKKEKVKGLSPEATKYFAEQFIDSVNTCNKLRQELTLLHNQSEKQKEQYGKDCKKNTIKKFLPLLDDIELAIAANPNVLAPLQKTLEKTKQSLGLIEIDSAPNTIFNPKVHEAILAEGEGDQELISEKLRSGYYYEGELIRPAMVKVKKQ